MKFLILFTLVLGPAAWSKDGKSGPSSQPSAKADMILDFRTAEDFEKGHLAGAIHFDSSDKDFKHKAEKFNKQASYQVYGKSKKDNEKALKIFKKAGIKKIENLGTLKEAAEKTKLTCEGPLGCSEKSGDEAPPAKTN